MRSVGIGRKIALLAMLSLASLSMSGCGVIKDVPPGYIGKILTPNGWKDGVIESGQIDIGRESNEGSGNRLALLEATSVTIKESFGKASEGNPEDHRIITKSRAPLTVDIYVQVMVPSDTKMRDSIFAQVTPKPTEGDKADNRVTIIKLEDVYDQFARMTIRGKTRQIFSQYKDYDEVMSNYEHVSDEVSKMIANTFVRNKVPLKLIAGQLSNVKADETVWAAENQKASADAQVAVINKVGRALKANPAYLEKVKWDTIKEIAGKDTTIILNDGGGQIGYNLPSRINTPPAAASQ